MILATAGCNVLTVLLFHLSRRCLCFYFFPRSAFTEYYRHQLPPWFFLHTVDSGVLHSARRLCLWPYRDTYVLELFAFCVSFYTVWVAVDLLWSCFCSFRAPREERINVLLGSILSLSSLLRLDTRSSLLQVSFNFLFQPLIHQWASCIAHLEFFLAFVTLHECTSYACICNQWKEAGKERSTYTRLSHTERNSKYKVRVGINCWSTPKNFGDQWCDQLEVLPLARNLRGKK